VQRATDEVGLAAETGVDQPVHPGRVRLGEQIDLQSAVHRHQLRLAGDKAWIISLLGAQHADSRIAVYPLIQARTAEGERSDNRLSGIQRARLVQGEHAVAEHL
jgi:hypothetical protein